MSAPTTAPARYTAVHLSTRRQTTGGLAEIHDEITGWFAADGADLDTLAAVDGLAAAIELGSFDRYRLEARLDLEVDYVAAAAPATASGGDYVPGCPTCNPSGTPGGGNKDCQTCGGTGTQ